MEEYRGMQGECKGNAGGMQGECRGMPKRGIFFNTLYYLSFFLFNFLSSCVLIERLVNNKIYNKTIVKQRFKPLCKVLTVI